MSVALAVIGWAYFRFANNPVIAARFDQQVSVPITAINVPVGYIARLPDKEAVVTVSPQRGQGAIKPDEIQAVVDLARAVSPTASETVVTVPVRLVAPNIVLQSLSPASVTVTVEKVEEKPFSLAVHYGGANSSNLVVRGSVTLTPLQAVVHGPSDSLARVTAVRVDVPIPPNASTIDEMVRPVAVDSLGSEISDLQVSPDLIRVQAQFTNGTGTGAPKH
ncbi:MAG: CdaR family protein [Vulcanimicrobiaceae bacterium]